MFETVNNLKIVDRFKIYMGSILCQNLVNGWVHFHFANGTPYSKKSGKYQVYILQINSCITLRNEISLQMQFKVTAKHASLDDCNCKCEAPVPIHGCR